MKRHQRQMHSVKAGFEVGTARCQPATSSARDHQPRPCQSQHAVEQVSALQAKLRLQQGEIKESQSRARGLESQVRGLFSHTRACVCNIDPLVLPGPLQVHESQIGARRIAAELRAAKEELDRAAGAMQRQVLLGCTAARVGARWPHTESQATDVATLRGRVTDLELALAKVGRHPCLAAACDLTSRCGAHRAGNRVPATS